MPLILLTNDDGVASIGLNTLYEKLQNVGDVVVVAPENERSAVSHGITLHNPLRISEIKENFYALNGTPADCVILALKKLLPRKPDLVVSGINYGGNLGDDVLYSGTVAGAREASLHNIKSFAVSLVLSLQGENDFQGAAKFCTQLAKKILGDGLPPGIFLNVNVPPDGYKRVRVTRQGNKCAENVIAENQDPRGRRYYWIGQEIVRWEEDTQSDYEAIKNGMISITPLQRDQTDYGALSIIADLESAFKAKKGEQKSKELKDKDQGVRVKD